MKRVTVRHGAMATLAAFAVLCVFAVSLGFIVQRVDGALLENRWQQMRITADVICDHIDDAVRLDDDWGTYNYTADYSPSVERLDDWQGVFAALYDDDANLLTRRLYVEGETPVDPWERAAFIEAIDASDFGEVTIPSIIMSGKEGDLRLYFRWIPTGNYDDKLLLVVGIGPDALMGSPVDLLVAWCAGLLAAAGVAVAVSLIVLLHHKHTVIPKEET